MMCKKTRNLKLLIYMFEQMARLKINFDKSEVLPVSGDKTVLLWHMQKFSIAKL
jgi:hypothetical protein